HGRHDGSWAQDGRTSRRKIARREIHTHRAHPGTGLLGGNRRSKPCAACRGPFQEIAPAVEGTGGARVTGARTPARVAWPGRGDGMNENRSLLPVLLLLLLALAGCASVPAESRGCAIAERYIDASNSGNASLIAPRLAEDVVAVFLAENGAARSV